MNRKHLMLWGIVIGCILFFSTIMIWADQNEEKSEAISVEEKENTKGTQESRVDQLSEEDVEKIDNFLFSIMDSLENEGFGENTFSFRDDLGIVFVQVVDQQFIDKNGKRIQELIQTVANEEKYGEVDVEFEIMGDLPDLEPIPNAEEQNDLMKDILQALEKNDWSPDLGNMETFDLTVSKNENPMFEIRTNLEASNPKDISQANELERIVNEVLSTSQDKYPELNLELYEIYIKDKSGEKIN